jgi:hypothetical protein
LLRWQYSSNLSTDSIQNLPKRYCWSLCRNWELIFIWKLKVSRIIKTNLKKKKFEGLIPSHSKSYYKARVYEDLVEDGHRSIEKKKSPEISP